MKKNKVWFITGASKGFGLAMVKRLLAAGDQVAATSRNGAAIEKHTGRHHNLLTLTTDISDPDSVNEAIHKTIDQFGRLDVVVNNAGYGLLGSIEALTAAEFTQSVNVNLLGTFNVIHAAMPYLRPQNSGYIINFSSVAGYKGHGNSAAYSAVKFAVVGLSEALAEEVKPFGIKVTVVAPGYFRTGFLEQDSIAIAKNNLPAYNADALADMLRQMDGNQPGDPDKLVGALIELAAEPDPPLHLLMGPDAYEMVTEKRKAEDAAFEQWKHITISTNFNN